MFNKSTYTLLVFVFAFLFLGKTVIAGPIVTFTYDTNDFLVVSGFQTGDSLTIEFEENTDLFNISSADIFSFYYTIASGIPGVAYRDAGWLEVGDIGDIFDYDGSTLSITYHADVSEEFGHLATRSVQGNAVWMQIGAGPYDNAFIAFNTPPSSATLSNPALGRVTYSAVVIHNEIPEPATMLLFGTGLASLAGVSIRRKKK